VPSKAVRWQTTYATVRRIDMAEERTAEESIGALAQGDAPVLETLAQMTMDTLERSGLDEETYMLVRVAALVAMDAAPVSYLMNLGAASEIGVPLERVQGTLVAIAPVVGSARIVSAASKMMRGIGLAELAEAEDE
jgi:4-carboxymuconolactone decarboxylase